MNYTITTISSVIKGTLSGNGDKNSVIKNLLIDSRNLSTAETSLFFAIVGERHDGHAYLKDLYEKGVRNFVVSVLPQNKDQFADANLILVKDTLLALQQLAAYHRSQFKIPVIGITGSNGKTIVKEWLYQLMREDKNSVRSP
jgi:UDP-N-acetylmuramyl pentapeptide synthase